MLLVARNNFVDKQHVALFACCAQQSSNMLPRNMLRWCKRGLKGSLIVLWSLNMLNMSLCGVVSLNLKNAIIVGFQIRRMGGEFLQVV